MPGIPIANALNEAARRMEQRAEERVRLLAEARRAAAQGFDMPVMRDVPPPQGRRDMFGLREGGIIGGDEIPPMRFHINPAHLNLQPMQWMDEEMPHEVEEFQLNWEQAVLPKDNRAMEQKDGVWNVARAFLLREFKSNVALFGVEVEVEGVSLPQEVKGFKAKADGSLRGESLEYVFNTPSNLQKSIDRIQELNKQFKESKTILDMSFRTSVHVHVNASNFTKTQLCTFLYLAFLMEEPLVRYCGESRVGNRFCLRVKDAEAKVQELEKLFGSDEQRLHVLDANHVKYSAINLASLRRFGTVEFRSMKGTTDVKILGTWLTALNNIYNAASKYKNPHEIANDLRKIGGRELARKTLGDVFNEFDYSSLNNDVHNSFSLLISLPYEYEMEEKK